MPPKSVSLPNQETHITLIGHTRAVTKLAFSPNGDYLASSSLDGSVIVWRLSDCRIQARLIDHTDELYALTFSSNGNVLASGGWDNRIMIYDATNWSKAGALDFGSETRAISLRFNPDGSILASSAGASSDAIRLWDITEQRQISVLEGHVGGVADIAFSGDGSMLASGGHDCLVKVWDIKTKRAKQACSGHTSFVECVAFCPGDRLLASGGADGALIIWNTDDGTQRAKLVSHSNGVNCLGWSSGGRLLLAGYGEGRDMEGGIAFWDTQKMERIRDIHMRGAVNAIAISINGAQLAAGCEDGTVRVWSLDAFRR